jgi:hypothetical protein
VLAQGDPATQRFLSAAIEELRAKMARIGRSSPV